MKAKKVGYRQWIYLAETLQEEPDVIMSAQDAALRKNANYEARGLTPGTETVVFAIGVAGNILWNSQLD